MNKWLNQPAIWRTELGAPVQRTDLSADRTLIAAAGGDGVLNLVAADDGRLLCRITGFEDCMSVDWHRDGHLAASDSNGLVRVWNADTLTSLADARAGRDSPPVSSMPVSLDVTSADVEFRAHNDTVRDLIFTPDGALLLTGGDDALIRFWDAGNYEKVDELSEHQNHIFRLTISPDGRFLASGSRDNTVRTWNLADRSPIHVFEKRQAQQRMVAVAFSPDGSLLAMGDIDGALILVELDTKERQILKNADAILDLTFNATGSQLIATDAGGNVLNWRVVNAPDGPKLERIDIPGWQAATSRLQAVSLDSDRQHTVTGSRDGELTCWPSRHRQPSEYFAEGRLMSFVDNETVISGTFSVELREIATGEVIQTMLESDDQWEHASRVCEQRLVALATLYDVVLCDLQKESELWRWHSDLMIHNVALSPDSETLAVSIYENPGSVVIVNLLQGFSVESLPLNSVRGLRFSPDSQTLAVGTQDDLMLFHREPSGWSRVPLVTGHDSSLSDVVFSPDGRGIATVSSDRSMKLWNNSSFTERDHVRVHDKPTRGVDWSEDGRRIATVSRDRRLKVWEANTLQPVLNIPLPSDGYRVRMSPDCRKIVASAGRGIVLLDSTPRSPDVATADEF